MNRRLWMNKDVDLVRTKAKQPASFDNFQTLVHQGCRIDRDPWTHLPGWMLQGVFHSDSFKVFASQRPEWSTRSGQDDSSGFVAFFTAQTLMDCVVFAVNR